MKTNNSISVRWFTFLPLLGLAAGAGLFACSGEFKAECPEGTVQNGGGDVGEACVAAGTGGAPGEGGQGGQGGPAGGQGVGGGQPGVCTPGVTRCQGEAQETCGEDGRWGAPTGCDIQCDAQGTKCVVPVQVAAGLQTTCALLSDGTIRCWGSNHRGKLGRGLSDESVVQLKPAAVPGLGGIKGIRAGYYNFCAVAGDGAAHCWGGNELEKLVADPSGVTDFVASPAAFAEKDFSIVDAGMDHLCALRIGGLYCRGSNAGGRLGNEGAGERSSGFVPVTVAGGAVREASVGDAHSCAVSSAGDVLCWGLGNDGELGQAGARESSSLPLKVMGNATAVTQLALGRSFGCALREDKTVACWGDNYYGELGRGAGSLGFSAEQGVAKFVSKLSSVVQVSASGQHACALVEDGSVWCWGDNSAGALGSDCGAAPCQNDTENSRVFSPEPMRVPLEDVSYVSAGVSYSCALKRDGSTYCWGYNNSGQLGNGEVSAANPTPVRVLWK